MLIFLIVHALSLNCEEELENIVEFDIGTRIETFRSSGEGLDSFYPIEDCRTKNSSVYVVVQWRKKRFPLASYTICMPEICKSDDVSSILQEKLKRADIYLNTDNISVSVINLLQKPQYSIISLWFLLCFLIVLVLTCYSTAKRITVNEKTSLGILKNFDFLQNLQNFLDFSPNFGNFEFFDGIRTICSISIVLIHTYFFSIFLPLINRKEFNQTINSLFFTVLGHLNYSVDVFFFIAGFLMCVLTLAEMKRKGEQFSWTLIIIRRLTRYLPSYFFIIGLDRVFPQGSPETIGTVNFYLIGQQSSPIWWKNLLMVQNHFLDESSPHLPWTWTIAADFQFYLISLIPIFLFSYKKTSGIFLALFIIGLSLVYSIYIIVKYQFYLNIFDQATNDDYLFFLYFPCWTRIPPYLLGVCVGFLYRWSLEKKESEGSDLQSANGMVEWFRWYSHNLDMQRKVYVWTAVLNVVFCLTPFVVCKFQRNAVFEWVSVVCLAFARIVVVVLFAGCAVPMMFGHQKILFNILSSKICKFYSKISYSFYLVHLIVVGAMNIGVNTHLNMSISRWAVDTFYIIIISSVVASILNILIEAPFARLEKAYLSR